MGKAGYNILEIRIIIRNPELTEIYIALEAWGDAPLGVQGWHHKVFPASMPVLEALQEALASSDYVLWPQKAPEARA